jgi:serine/threonine protein kinase
MATRACTGLTGFLRGKPSSLLAPPAPAPPSRPLTTPHPPPTLRYLGVCLHPPCVVTEYCARGSLNDVLKRARTSTSLRGHLDWSRRLHMALDAAKGMLYLHSCTPAVIHRDLKSANLLVDKHWRVKVGRGAGRVGSTTLTLHAC